MRNRVFKKYEILHKIYENQVILQQNKRGLSIKKLKNILRKGNLKLIYDIVFLNIRSGLLTKISGRGYTTTVTLSEAGIRRIKWLSQNSIQA